MLNGHGLDFFTAAKTVRLAHPGEENSELVVDFSYSPNGGAGVPTGSFLFNGNSRTQTLDRIHLRPVHPFQKLAGV